LKLKTFKFTVGLALIVLILSAIPGNRLPDLNFRAGDKIGHFLAYAALTAAFCTEYARHLRWSSRTGRWLIAILCVCSVYGAILEFMQGELLYQRTFDYADMAANTAGAIIGSIVYLIFQPLLKRYERFY
jgi:VanZ family protein